MKTAIITGAAGGMGGATLKLFKSRGYKVLATDRVEVTGSDFQVVGDVSDEVTWQKITR
jgi:NAD(P)-dependent dehydrogenase (short-subunit alcohol dehydrogenase family)